MSPSEWSFEIWTVKIWFDLKYCTVDTHKEDIKKLRLIFWFREVKNCKLSMYIIIQRESPLIFIKNHGESSWRKKQNYAVSVLLELPNPIRWKKREPFSHVHKTNLYDKKKTNQNMERDFFHGNTMEVYLYSKWCSRYFSRSVVHVI